MIYTLYLNAIDGVKVQPNNRYADVEWRVNWDNLFQNKNYKHQKCIVKIELVSSKDIRNLTTTEGIFGDFTGYLACNLSSNNQSSFKGLNSTEYSLGGTILGLFAPDPNAKYVPYDPNFTVNNEIYVNSWTINTMDTDGVLCVVPTGETTFRLTFYRGDEATDVPKLSRFNTTYVARLSFELV